LGLKAIFFDFDGTITESAGIKTNAFRRLFSDSGYVEEIVQYHIRNAGVNRYQKFDYIYANILKKPLSETEKQELSRKFSGFVVDEIIECPLVKGAAEFLRKYSQKLMLYVLSSTPDAELKHIAGKRGLARFFRECIGAPAKKSQSALGIMQSKGIKKEDAIFVGDSLADLEEAGKAGIMFVRVITPEQGQFPKGIKTVKDFFELEKIVEDLL
jgi:phosphoglycolate phosphatase-like HAD superfamily hydrolase